MVITFWYMWLLKMFIVLKNYYNENYDYELKIF